jgi:hypothetical protein
MGDKNETKTWVQLVPFSRNPNPCRSNRFFFYPNETATCVILQDLFHYVRKWRLHVWEFTALGVSMCKDLAPHLGGLGLWSSTWWLEVVLGGGPWVVLGRCCVGLSLVEWPFVTLYMLVLHIQGAQPPSKWPHLPWFLIHLGVGFMAFCLHKTKKGKGKREET